jgi:SAM-dependent methyltransferase
MNTNSSSSLSHLNNRDATMAFTPNLFGKLARYYDALHRTRDYAREAEFVSGVFQKFRGSAMSRTLELFCGTGSHSIHAARHGLNVVGLDISPQMLDIARRKASAEEIGVQFQLGDCRTLRYDEDFDLVFGFGQSLHYLITHREIACVLTGVHTALTLGGICVFDVINGWKMLEQHHVDHYDSVEDGTKILRLVGAEPDRARRIATSEVTWIIQLPDGRLDLERTSEEYRIFFVDELEFLLEVCGFETLGIYGDYTTDCPISTECLAISMVARKVQKT